MTAAVDTGAPRHFHSATTGDLPALLASDPGTGLSTAEAAARLARTGPNSLPTAAHTSLPVRIARQIHNPLIYVLLAAGAVTAALGEYVDSSVILGVVLINAVIGLVQESKAEAELAGLRSMVRTEARVVRDGRERTVPSAALVPGDLVKLEAGDKVPADLRLTHATALRIDESALTGESEPVGKHVEALPADLPVADRRNMAYSGTLVTAGSATGLVCATGTDTELGAIHRLIGAAETLATPLTEKLAGFSRMLTVGILALAAVTFAVGLLRGHDAVAMFTAAIALAVGAIPEGLPAAVTVTLAIGVARMARRRAVIRHLPTVETLGSTTVICTDKTGTLTQNQMTVQAVWTPRAWYAVTGAGYSPEGTVRDAAGAVAGTDRDHALHWTLLTGTLCNDASLTSHDGTWDVAGDPTEGAMIVAAAKAGLETDALRARWPRQATLTFNSERQFMATLHRDDRDGATVVLVKGALERLLERCSLQMDADGTTRPLDSRTVTGAAAELADQGLRVLATALRPHGNGSQSVERLDDDALGSGLVLTGLQAMLDPPRTAAAAAVAACRTAGIAVKMITGDHAATATAIARDVGLLDSRNADAVMTGADLAALPDDELPEAAQRTSVFARVSPEQKLRLVAALQSRGHVVAMTGDGVNDAPALRQAGIGVAMGAGGTDVAKEAADMVLTDDDFATIEAAVEEGRGVFDNLTKFITWTLPTNLGEGLVILAAIMFGAALPILPGQILWINMTTAVALGLMLAFEPKEPGIMTRRPRKPGQPLFTRALILRTALVSVLLVAGAWWLFDWELAHGADLAQARTAAVNVFVTVQACYLFSCRTLTGSAWRIGAFTNPWILLGVAVQAAGQLALTYTPAMNTVFDTAPIGADVWLRILAIAAATSLVVALEKRLTMGAATNPARRR
ncbi:cation-transporting P-type ATPase [Glycomyces terrestris]|uniref:Cation-transporting P-type ATPase n=1 Tax=Glycomyces terrestris TaxID=2493553 RepID=A0A426V3L0_9ACTN|nr:cation-transporting P-type ATPase [Glycomyces terrestris]RRS01435.1 cation-transporting P-type ATPase [Glycomyces terrestris]